MTMLDRRLVRRIHPLTAILMAVTGCTSGGTQPGTTPDPRAGDAMTLYALDGDRYPGDPTPPSTPLLHGWSVIKSCQIDDLRIKEEILAAFDAGIADHRGGPAVDCFRPRHAIRTELDGVTTDYLICFECSNWMSWTDDRRTGGGHTSDRSSRTLDRILGDCPPTE